MEDSLKLALQRNQFNKLIPFMNQEYQQTLKAEIHLSGVGLHTGQPVNLTIKGAKPNYGFRFQRIDLPGSPVFKADVDYVVDTSRGTTLEYNGIQVHTTEHLLAALVGMGIDNAHIELDASEVPILDGSSKGFVEAIKDAGIEEQEARRVYYTLDRNLHLCDAEKNAEFIAIPADHYQITGMINFDSKVLGTQHFALKTIEQFEAEVANSRTFCFLHELQSLLQHNLIKGGSLDNAIVVVDRAVSEEELVELSKVFNQPKVEVKLEGILNNLELHHANEPARHKVLDVIGDLALSGYHLKAHIIANRPGHSSNVAFAKKIKEYVQENKHLAEVPAYDPSAEPVYDIKHILNTLPHKYPFLLVDKIISMTEQEVVGLKNVTVNEPFFQGHFPRNPVMPGVLQIEAMAQVGGILALNHIENPEDYDTIFLKIDNARFKKMVVPGDTLIMKLELSGPIRRGLCEMHGTVFVGNKVATEADLIAQIIPHNR